MDKLEEQIGKGSREARSGSGFQDPGGTAAYINHTRRGKKKSSARTEPGSSGTAAYTNHARRGEKTSAAGLN